MKRLRQREIEDAIGPLDKWAHECHFASLMLVRSGILGENVKVARGWSPQTTMHQHSWVIDGGPYSLQTEILDITAWSYSDIRPKVWYTPNLIYHTPHGLGHLPREETEMLDGPRVELEGLTPRAEVFLRKRYPGGYGNKNLFRLANAPVMGWPADDIYRALIASGKGGLIPVDMRAMVLDGGYV